MSIDVSSVFGAQTQSAVIEICKQISYVPQNKIIVEIGDNFFIKQCNNHINIMVQNKVQVFRALGLLKQGEVNLTENPSFKNLGFMIDVSRNAVLTEDAIKALLRQMSLMGYNTAMLYTEDVYEIEGVDKFGYMRGKYTKNQIKLLDEYALALGIELVPCIQTLAHLENTLKWSENTKFKDTKSVLICGEDEVYDLIENMISTCAECYTSKKIHLGMDEAMDLGLGRYLQKNGYENGFSIMKKHLNRVEDITKKYNLQPMMWSDMYFRLGSHNNLYYDESCVIPTKVIEDASSNIDLVYWDYYHDDKEFYSKYIDLHSRFKAKTIFAGALWTWIGAAVNYPLFFKNSLPALQACVEKGVEDVLLTAWGDNGAEANIKGFLVGLMVYAEYCYCGEYNEARTKKRFAGLFNEDMQAFLDIGKFDDMPQLEHLQNYAANPSKFLLYQDVLCGLFDKDVEGLKLEEHFASLIPLFKTHSSNSNNYADLFDFYAKLASLLSAKTQLNRKLLLAYGQEDRAALKSVLHTELAATQTSAKVLRESWRSLWYSTNKAFGFEVIDIRLGAVMARIDTAKWRVEQFVNGEIDCIDELDEARQNVLLGKSQSGMVGAFLWENIVTACKI